jgi:hypothetical protein
MILIRFREVLLTIDYWKIIREIFGAYLIRIISSFYAKSIMLIGWLRSFERISANVKRTVTNVACLRFLIIWGIIGRGLISWFDFQYWQSEISNLKVFKFPLNLILLIMGETRPLWLRNCTIERFPWLMISSYTTCMSGTTQVDRACIRGSCRLTSKTLLLLQARC